MNLDITTHGNGSHGLLVQSLAGGASKSGSSYGLFGASNSGGWGGNGGNVDATSRGNITTHDNASHGVLAQSIGGGGTGGMSIAGSVSGAGKGAGSVTRWSWRRRRDERLGRRQWFGRRLRQCRGRYRRCRWCGGDSSAVSSIVRSDIYTVGDNSFGLTYQSIGGGGGGGGGDGGGGGAGGMNISAGISVAKTGAGNVVFGLGGFGGEAGTVKLDHIGSIFPWATMPTVFWPSRSAAAGMAVYRLQPMPL